MLSNDHVEVKIRSADGGRDTGHADPKKWLLYWCYFVVKITGKKERNFAAPDANSLVRLDLHNIINSRHEPRPLSKQVIAHVPQDFDQEELKKLGGDFMLFGRVLPRTAPWKVADKWQDAQLQKAYIIPQFDRTTILIKHYWLSKLGMAHPSRENMQNAIAYGSTRWTHFKMDAANCHLEENSAEANQAAIDWASLAEFLIKLFKSDNFTAQYLREYRNLLMPIKIVSGPGGAGKTLVETPTLLGASIVSAAHTIQPAIIRDTPGCTDKPVELPLINPGKSNPKLSKNVKRRQRNQRKDEQSSKYQEKHQDKDQDKPSKRART